MGLNISQPYELIEYTLSHESLSKPQVVEEPIGWKDDLMDLKRSEKNYTAVTRYSLNLEFFNVGANTIKSIYANFGLEAKIVLTKRIQHPTKQEVVTKYIAYLDGYSFTQKQSKVKVNTLESDLSRDIKGYQSEKVEITRETSFNGDDIGELKTERVDIIGKDILLVSKFGIRQGDESIQSDHSIFDTKHYTTFPMDLYADSHPDAADVTNYRIDSDSNDLPKNGSTQNMLWSVSEEDTTVGQLKIDVDITYDDFGEEKMQYMFGTLYLLVFEDVSETGGNTQYKYKRREKLASTIDLTGLNKEKSIKYSGSFYDFTILKGESLALGVFEVSGAGDALRLTENNIDVQIISNSYEEGTQCDTILPFELFERLLRIMSGRTDTVLVSNYLGRSDLGYEQDGAGAYIGVTSGFLARGFRDKPLITSFKDAMQSYMAIRNLSYVVETAGFKEVVRIEPSEYFFNNTVRAFSNPVSVKDLEIKVAESQSFSGIEIGYEKGAEEYEEAVGLDEFNGRMNWVTPLAGAESRYTKLSKYRADTTGLIFAIRKSVKFFPTEDTSYDKDVFLLDMKKPLYGSVLQQRVWQDDYSEIPGGLYSPATATNLRLAPSELFKLHESFFNSCLKLYENKLVTYGSGVGNVLVTFDGVLASRDIPISELAKPVYRNFWITYNYDTNSETEDMIVGNIYGIFEFKDSDGLIWQYRLFEFKKNKYKGLLINGIQ